VNAVTWGGAIFQFSNITGPALGGLLFTLPLAQWVPDTALQGAGIVYVFTLGSLGWFLVLVASLHTRPGRMEHRAASLKVVLAGFQYVRRSPMLLGASSLDLFVVLLGGATALMPFFAHDILHQGPRGLGLLRAAPAAGALTMALLLARFPFRRKAGLRLFVCVAIYGAATVVFGVSRNLWLSLGALAFAGAADTISVIIRGSLLQLATPPEMRGRVSAVNSLFIGASNELGEFESGLTAQWWGVVRATIAGGLGALAVAGLWAVLFPDLRRADELSSARLRPRAVPVAPS
jgi:MFS family permease